MNRIILLWMFSMLFLFLSSCEDDKTNNLELKPVSNITYEAKPGQILFKWDNPEANGLSYVEITFQKKVNQEDTSRILVVNPKNEQLVYGLPDANPRDYTFTAYYGNQKAQSQVISAHAEETPFDAINNSLTVKQTLEGVNVSWDNQNKGEFYIELNYVDATRNANYEYEIVVKEQGKGERSIPIDGIYQTTLSFKVSDEYNNQSSAREINYQRLESEGWLNRKMWLVADVSTEETVQEQPYGGPAVNLLDDDVTTFWHSRWSSNTTGYPHYVTFDLARMVKLEKAKIVRRQGNANLNTFEIQGGESIKGPWTKIVEYEILGNNSPQEIPFDEPVNYRYIRMYCTKGGGGNIHASMAEFYLYGQDIVEE